MCNTKNRRGFVLNFRSGRANNYAKTEVTPSSILSLVFGREPRRGGTLAFRVCHGQAILTRQLAAMVTVLIVPSWPCHGHRG